MVWPIAMMLFQQSDLAPCTGMDVSQLAQLLERNGFSVTLSAKKQSIRTIQLRSVTASCAVSPSDGKPITFCSLWNYYQVQPGVTTDELEHNLRGNFASIKASLGGFVSIRFNEKFENGLTRQRLVFEIQSYFASVEQLQAGVLKRYGFPKADTKPAAPDLSQRVYFVDSGDLNYLAKSWGWEMRGGYGGSSPGWICPAVIDHALYWMTEDPNQPNGGTAGFRLGLRLKAKGLNTVSKTEELGWATLYAGGETVSLSRWVSLSGGKSLGELHDEILDFAHRCEKLAKDRGYEFAPDPNAGR